MTTMPVEAATDWDFVVRVKTAGSSRRQIGFLLNERVALSAFPPRSRAQSVTLRTLHTGAAYRATRLGKIGAGPLGLYELAEPPLPATLRRFAPVAAGDRVSTVGVSANEWTVVHGTVVEDNPLRFDGRPMVPSSWLVGAPLVVDGRLGGVVVASPDGELRAAPFSLLVNQLVEWVPEVRDDLLPVTPLTVATSFSTACWRVLGLYEGLVEKRWPSEKAIWLAVVIDGRSSSELTSSVVAAHVPSAGIPLEPNYRELDATRLMPSNELLAQAHRVCDSTSHSDRIHLRHLVAALLLTSSDVLVELGGDPGAVTRDFLAFLRERVPDDDHVAWEALFATPTTARPPAATRARAGYNADAIGQAGQLADELLVGSDVETLCDVLAAKDAVPPLSVGLFGRWGGGKSYFMGLMQQRMAALAAAARQAEAAKLTSAYCSNIVQITFNSWHYMDANLWASLAVRIFEGISVGDGGADVEASADVAMLLGELHHREEELASLDVKINKAVSDDRVDEVARELGIDAGRREVVDLLAEASRLLGFLRALKLRVLGGPATRGRRLVALSVVVALAVGVAVGLWRAGVPRGIVSLPLWAAVVGVLAPASRRARSALKTINDVLANAGLESVDVTTERAAKDRRVKEIKEQLATVDRRRGLYQFVLERAGSEDYRRHFGLISIVRDDFDKLARQLAVAAPGRRIVLYIDDLDRCPPERVVEVLQAVHLLLAFPLFVVVVGVDPRWLLRSLERHYDEILSTGNASGDEPAPRHGADAFWETTPQNYLEKIFQIPYALRPMDVGGFGRLVDALVTVPPRSPDADGGSAAVDEMTVDDARPAASSVPDEASSSQEEREPPPESRRPARRRQRTVGMIRPSPSAPTASAVDPNPLALQVTDDERLFVHAVARLVRTPREAKRLVNLYRIVRASLLSGEQLDRFLRDGDHRVVITLLAVLVGYPRQALALFARIRSADPPDAPWATFVTSLDPEGTPQWSELVAALSSVLDDQTAAEETDPPLGRYRAWLPAVERFSFDAVLEVS
jgi:hypothetical protein